MIENGCKDVLSSVMMTGKDKEGRRERRELYTSLADFENRFVDFDQTTRYASHVTGKRHSPAAAESQSKEN